MAVFDFFGPLNAIGRTFADRWDAEEKRQTLASLGQRLGGDTPDYAGALQLASATGDPALMLGLAGLGRKERERTASRTADEASWNAGGLGRGAPTGLAGLGSQPAPVSVAAPPPAPPGLNPGMVRTAPDRIASQDQAVSDILDRPDPPQNVARNNELTAHLAVASGAVPDTTTYDPASGKLSNQLPPAPAVATRFPATSQSSGSDNPSNAAPTAPSRMAQAAPASDLPAAGATDAQFTVPGTSETYSIAKRPELYRAIQALKAGGSQMSTRTHDFWMSTYKDELTKARADETENRRVQRESQTPVTDPVQRRALGVPDSYTGPVMRDGYGRITAPLKPATEVNIGEKGDAAFSTAAGGAIAKRFEKLSEEGDQGRSDITAIRQLRGLGDKITTGGMAALRGRLAEYGVKIGDDIGAIEAYGSLVDRMVPAQRIPGSGSTSDFDAKTFKSSLPRLMNTPEGNALVGNTLEALAQDKVDRAAIAEKALTREITPGEAIKQLRALPNPDLAFKSGLSALGKAGKLKDVLSDDKPKAQTLTPALINDARTAIQRGAPAASVIERLRQQGYDPSGL